VCLKNKRKKFRMKPKLQITGIEPLEAARKITITFQQLKASG